MGKLNIKQQESRKEIVNDTTLPFEVRKKAHEELMDNLLNPKAKKDFDPDTFDPMEYVEGFEVKRRSRAVPPKRLPTGGLKPKQILEGQMVGQFESKQDLYLLIAWLSHRVSDLEDQLNKQ